MDARMYLLEKKRQRIFEMNACGIRVLSGFRSAAAAEQGGGTLGKEKLRQIDV